MKYGNNLYKKYVKGNIFPLLLLAFQRKLLSLTNISRFFILKRQLLWLTKEI